MKDQQQATAAHRNWEKVRDRYISHNTKRAFAKVQNLISHFSFPQSTPLVGSLRTNLQHSKKLSPEKSMTYRSAGDLLQRHRKIDAC